MHRSQHTEHLAELAGQRISHTAGRGLAHDPDPDPDNGAHYLSGPLDEALRAAQDAP